MTKKQVAVLKDVIAWARGRAKTSQVDGVALLLHTHVVQPLTDLLAPERRTVSADDLMCGTSKVRPRK